MGEKYVRGIRGAITAESNTSGDIIKAAKRLIMELVEANEVIKEDIASIFFTTTPDLNADFPASAVSKGLGWYLVPLLCAREIDVPTGTPRVIRVLMHVNTTKTQAEIKHLYLDKAARLRPDLSGAQ